MTSHQKRSLSSAEWLGLVLSSLKAACKAVVTALTVFRNRRAVGWPTSKIIGFSMLQQMSSIPMASRVALTPTSGEAIRAFCEKSKLPLRSTVLESTTKPVMLHETLLTTPEPRSTVLLYIHGGGYVIPGSQPQFEASLMIAKAARCSRIFWLEYTLAPGLRYPGQLIQAVAALRHLLEDEHLDPAQIILGGDSAGAHLALSLIVHQILPCPEAGPSLNLSSNLKALVLLSPWLTLPTNSASFRENGPRDHISVSQMNDFIAQWRPKPDEVWADMLTAPTGFWQRNKIPADSIGIVVGLWESFRDDILKFANMVGVTPGGLKDRLIEEETGIHVDFVIDLALHLPQAKSTTELLEWTATL